MHLSLKVVVQQLGSGETCEDCGNTEELCYFAIELRKGTASTYLGPFCINCLENERTALIEEPDLGKGRRPPGKKTIRRARRQEEELAADTGARRHKGSGNQDHAKGDTRKRGVFRGECKHTKAKQYTVTRKDLNKISAECSYGEVPVLDVAFLDNNGRTEDRWVMIPYSEWVKQHAAGND